ncbi:F-box protein At3g07870-like [Mercurialis annua]|uniref:F-box protein At3g07870-like n=1 Tax=Mercurialis annua TaxID=3986 RepID=UPI00215F804B|nr:F-box protein At3g07870-like [Mercurialis annua]
MLRSDGPGSFSRTLYLLDIAKLKPYSEFLLPLNQELESSGFDVLNSCNGLVCLARFLDKNPVLVCNPITQEHIQIPRKFTGSRTISRIESESESEIVASGFGFSSKSNQFKVIKIMNPRKYNYGSTGFEIGSYIRYAEVYILGTSSWRKVTEFAPQSLHSFLFPTYWKETINWACVKDDKFDNIISFDFDNERFEIISPPPRHRTDSNCIRMQELGGCLSVCDCSSFSKYLDIWLMKDFSGKRLWRKVITIRMWPFELKSIEPITFLNNGKLLLMVHDSKNLVCYNHLLEKFKYFKVSGIQSYFEAFSFVPNFLSLKDIVKGNC